jgi:hypothetical protein
MPDVRITDPDDLTREERELAARLAAMPASEFDAAVSRYIDQPSDAMRQVLASGDLVQDTVAALERLQAAVRARLAVRGLPAADRQLLDLRSQAIAALRAEMRPYLNLAVAAAAEKGTRRRAERVLGRARYPELKAIMRDLEAGMDENAALAAHRARTGGS